MEIFSDVRPEESVGKPLKKGLSSKGLSGAFQARRRGNFCARRAAGLKLPPTLPLAPLTAGTKGGLNKPKKNVLSSRDPNSVSIALQAGVTKSQSSGAAADTAQRLANRAD
jgi:hypothetical protein